MKFEVRRINDWNNKPCEEATMETRPNVDIRSVNSPYKIWRTEEEVQENWFNEGKNHRAENGRIKRDLEDEVYWVVEFQTLEELLEFQEKYGEVIISDFMTKSSHKLIEIRG